MIATKSQRGATLPETLLVMTVLLGFMFGIVDFGRALYTYGFVAQLARQGARWAIVRGSNCTALDHCPARSGTSDVQSYLQSLNEGATDASKIGAVLSWPSCPQSFGTGNAANAPGCIAAVTVTYPFKFMLPFVSGATLNLSSTSQMIISN